MPLDRNSPLLYHTLQNAGLLTLSLATVPLSSLLLLLSYAFPDPNFIYPGTRADANKPRKTILITGISMSKGLCLARHFHLAGHRVIGADFSPLACGRWSVAVSRFYTLTRPDASSRTAAAKYILDLLRIVNTESVDLWVSCSGVASAVQDGEAKEAVERQTRCRCVQFDVEQTERLHEKDAFIEYVRDLGLTVPETMVVRSREEASEKLLSEDVEKSEKRYVMKCIGMDDSSRGDIMTLLPRPGEQDTREHLHRMNVSKENPFILQQFINGREYCTHALVIKGVVKVFCACPSSDMLMHYESLPSDSALTRAMLKFTNRVAEDGGSDFSGHLSFDFLVDEGDVRKADDEGIEPTLYPIECNPRAHTAVVLFKDTTTNMIDAYLSLLEPDAAPVTKKEQTLVTPLTTETKYYWIGNDFVTRTVLPVFDALRGQLSVRKAMSKTREFVDHVLSWYDGTYEQWDPLPAWWLYHVYWPIQFADSLVGGKKWSRVNVSTTKVFGC